MEAVADFRIQTDRDPPTNGSCAISSSSASAVFRKIEFHPARKPFNGFSNGGSDFKIETLNPNSANKRVLSAPSVKKPAGSDLLEYGLDPELSFSITFRKIGAGLENLGNTCFLNSVLQCLTYTEPLAAYLDRAAHQKYCHVAGFCALCAIQKHVRNARQGTGRILAPKDLVSNLRCISRNFRNCRQEDAHEYMINLLECMHKCCLPSGVPSESSDAYRRSLVHKIFGGSLRSQVKCEQCSHCSNKFDPFLDLSLDISRADSLQKALLRFTAVELLDDGAKVYQCERCKQKVKARKQLTVSKAPDVLTVHLKRFEAHRSEKIDRKVQFSPAIDMKPFVSGPYEGNLKYTLYGVLVHYGRSIHSGHYACFVRTSTGMWYSLDDNRVRQVSEKTVFDQKAYMLFYVRDRQNAASKNAISMVKKDTLKDSLPTNKASLIQVNGSAVIRPCSLSTPIASTQKDPPSTVEAKEILQRENGSKSCDLRAHTAVSTEKDLNSKDTLQKEVPLAHTAVPTEKDLNSKDTLQKVPLAHAVASTEKDLNSKDTLQKEVPLAHANVERSLVKEDSKAACQILPGKTSPLLDGSINTQILVNLPTCGDKAENSVDKKDSVNNLNEPANSVEVKNASNGDSPIEEAVHIAETLGQQSEEPATSSESMKTTSDIKTLTTPRKTRKNNMKQIGLRSFKLSLGIRKMKKQKRGRPSASAVKKRTTDEKHSISHIACEVASGAAFLQGKENSVGVHSKRISNNNENTLELKERTNQNGAVLASDQQQPLRSSEANQNAKRKRESSKEERISLEKESVNIITRGLPETVVAKWDEEVSAFGKMGSKSESIGYVADEWDEEYDRGKKKKIRMKEEMYGGPNPFQMIASKKQAETKKKWTQRLTSAKTGFRI